MLGAVLPRIDVVGIAEIKVDEKRSCLSLQLPFRQVFEFFLYKDMVVVKGVKGWKFLGRNSIRASKDMECLVTDACVGGRCTRLGRMLQEEVRYIFVGGCRSRCHIVVVVDRLLLWCPR